jgi:uracil DNA glycosylase
MPQTLPPVGMHYLKHNCLIINSTHPEPLSRHEHYENEIRSANKIRDLLINETFMPQKKALKAT